MGNKWTRWAAKEKEQAYYQYSIKNGVSKGEAAKACDYAKATGQSPKDVTPKSQSSSTSCGNKLAYGTSSSSSTSSSSNTSSTSSSSSTSTNKNTSLTSNSSNTSSTESLSSVLTSDNIKALFTVLLNVLKNIFAPNMQNQYNQYGNVGQPPKGVDPNQYAKQYANANNLTLEQAKQRLQSMYGTPQQPNNNFSEMC